MSNSSKIIPEFMSNNPDNIFRVIMPLNLQIDYENYANSHFNVLVRDGMTPKY